MTTQKQKIAFISFDVPKPYAEGHVLSAEEAEVMNSAYGRRVSDLCSAEIKELFANEVRKEVEFDAEGKPLDRVIEWVPGWDAARAQAEIVNDAVNNFSWTTARVRDPVEAEMKRLATVAVDKKIADTKAKLSTEDRKAKIKEVLLANEAALRKIAKKNVESILPVDIAV